MMTPAQQQLRARRNDMMSETIAKGEWLPIPSGGRCKPTCLGWNGWAMTCHCGNAYPYFSTEGRTVEDLKLVVECDLVEDVDND
mgnify:CR=1 FL=1